MTPSTDSNIVSMQMVHKQYHPEDLVTLAHSIQSSKEFVTQNTMSKLTVIAEQMKALEEVSFYIYSGIRIGVLLNSDSDSGFGVSTTHCFPNS